MVETSHDRAIGRLEGKLDALIETVKAQGEKSDQGRAKLYERVEGVERATHNLDGRVQTIEGTVKKMNPLVEEFGRLKQRGLGMLMLLGIVWMLLGGLLLNGISWIVHQIIRIGGGQ